METGNSSVALYLVINTDTTFSSILSNIYEYNLVRKLTADIISELKCGFFSKYFFKKNFKCKNSFFKVIFSFSIRTILLRLNLFRCLKDYKNISRRFHLEKTRAAFSAPNRGIFWRNIIGWIKTTCFAGEFFFFSKVHFVVFHCDRVPCRVFHRIYRTIFGWIFTKWILYIFTVGTARFKKKKTFVKEKAKKRNSTKFKIRIRSNGRTGLWPGSSSHAIFAFTFLAMEGVFAEIQRVRLFSMY